MNDNNDLTSLLKHEKILVNKNAIERVDWAIEHLPSNFILSSSFGIQSAVMLHLVTQIKPDIPVILTDTGHLFPETYSFIQQLTEKLKLNLHIYKAKQSPALQLKQFGKLWEQGSEGLKRYHYLNKIEPLDRAMSDFNAKTWFSGIRHQQSNFRKELSVLGIIRGHLKVHPIIDWTNRDIQQYLAKHNLPYHPLFDKGYSSVGDIHSTHPLQGSDARFSGKQRECGLHTVNNIL